MRRPAAYNIGGLSVIWQGDKVYLLSQSEVAIFVSTQIVQIRLWGLAGLVDQDAQIQDSHAEGDINNVTLGRVGVAGYLWDRTSDLEKHAGSLTNVLMMSM